MRPFVALSSATEDEVHGNKATGLAKVYSQVPVPPGLVVPGEWVLQCLTADSGAYLERLLDEVSSRPEDEFALLVQQIDTLLGQLRLGTDRAELLRAAVRSAALGPLLVVRSSSRDEDDSRLSFAGVFESLIDVEEADLGAAVCQVWRSAFSPKALLQYRRIGRRPAANHLNVLVQQAIAPQVAGVAFSEPTGDAYLEWTPGHGADLVGGLVVPTGERLGRTVAVRGWRRELQSALVTLAADGTGHDVEWAWDGQTLWIVQVRPRTADVGSHRSPDGLRVAPLYEGDAHDLVFGECAGEYSRIRNKRRHPRAIALARGARVPGGWLVNWDPAGSAEALASWSRQLPARLVIDSSPTERQYIIANSELAATVTGLASAGQHDEGEFAFLCREYLRGETALLSTVAEDGSVYVEASEEGLLALNRGFGTAQPVSAEQLELLVGPQQAEALRGTTREHARQLHPRATLEWVVSEGGLFFVDYSAPSTERAGAAAPAALDGSRVLSAGLAGGRVQHLGIDEVMTESSIAPIISIAQPVSAEDETLLLKQLQERLSLGEAGVIVAASRPIAVLSMLIGVVDGFLFEEGALLSHLGILLREAGVPAAIVGTGNLPPEGAAVELVHGTVIVQTDDPVLSTEPGATQR
ncbi:MAG: hypothetical protein M3Y77_08485 [Actinomycetota bacterium]|nr:hypothetical protein [Actinomycetota bacterium]MDQ2957838.1 hypothetical protein [Actinomycetota bacterium]